MVSPNFIHLLHIEIYRDRCRDIETLAKTLSPDITIHQLKNLRLKIREDWIRLGWCWCVAQQFPAAGGPTKIWQDAA